VQLVVNLRMVFVRAMLQLAVG